MTQTWSRWLGLALLVALWALPQSARAQVVTQSTATVIQDGTQTTRINQDKMGESLVQLADEARDMPVASTVRLIVIMTALTFVPAIILVMTPFTRFVVVFSMLRQALGLQQSPPNQVLIGLALFMSMLVMQPTITEVNETAFTPYMDGKMDTSVAIDTAMRPMRRFMLANTRKDDLGAVMAMGRLARPETLDELPVSAVVSAFVLSELKTAFVIAVKVYLPFLVIDIVIANILLSMGMMVLPPVIISLPFKLMLFVLMDGWNLLVRSMASGFGGF
jgi:flagellar biosynthetic protein FliP